ncbi:MAG: 50S ribosomal protein L22 [Nitrospiraceae bacterium]|nr:50S ribosomal protein L22 [Nitrospiraceae bacterium]
MAVESREYYKKGEKGFSAENLAKAVLRKVDMSASKVRRVANLIRGKKVDVALNILSNVSNKPAVLIGKTLKSAIANAENKGLDPDELIVKTVYIDEGPTLKRFRARAMGKAGKIRRRSCHITVMVSKGEV